MNTDDGPDPSANYSILNRGKRHDYFTSCLPWPQKGPSVALPLGTSADIPRSRFTVQTSHKTTFMPVSLFLSMLMKFFPVILFR